MPKEQFALRIAFAGLLISASQACSPPRAPGTSPTPAAGARTYRGGPTTPAITTADLKTRLYAFADDSMRGRAAGTADNLRGTAYIAREAQRIGLEPAGENGTYFQPLRVRIRTQPDSSLARNVVAILRGGDPKLRGQYVTLGAHNDHLPPVQAVDHDSLRAFNIVARPGGAESPPAPVTEMQWTQIRAILDSMRSIRPPRPDSINNGADDDGTGSMALLEIAEAFVGARPKRSLLFVWHTGEELGMLGSTYFTGHPTVPRDSIVTQLNIDMIGRGGVKDAARDVNGQPVYGGPTYVELIGSRRLSSELGDIVEEVNRAQPTPLALDYALDANGEPHQYYCRSDHYSYARNGIPVTFFFTGAHHDYHQVTDEPQYIDYSHYGLIVRLVHDIAERVANLDHRPVVDKPKPDPFGACVQ